MTIVPVLLLLLIALIVSSFISRVLPAVVPRPLVQIAIGAALGMFPALHIALDPDVFFLLFVPPLLFFDGWRIPNKDLVADRAITLQLALGLVFLTVLGIGWFVHWLIPGMPLPVAFALAAAISPTDAISVVSIASKLPVAPRTLRILTNESLLNDATGLVCLRFAVAATLSGTFSVVAGLANFVWIAAGGIVIGLLTALGIARACNWLSVRIGEEPGVQIVISLLIPFLAYYLAEIAHCSGILAAVGAGVAMSYVEASGTGEASTRVQRTSVWETIHFAINGIVFVMLGEQLPKLMTAADQALYAVGERHLGWGIVYVVVIYVALIIIRGLWLLIILPRDEPDSNRKRFSREWAVTTLACPRGAITLAGAMTLPYSLSNGSPFPGRDMAIVLAMGVILVSLLVVAITLPALLSDIASVEPIHSEEEDVARITSATAALKQISSLEQELKSSGKYDVNHARALSGLQNLYSSVIASKSKSGQAAEQNRASESVHRMLRIEAIKAERDAIFELLREEKIASDVADKLVRELDLLQAHHDEK